MREALAALWVGITLTAMILPEAVGHWLAAVQMAVLAAQLN